MDISPQRVRTAEFRTVKRGLDADEVREFLSQVADELERAQNQATAMEARARAAVARLQEISESGAAQPMTSEPETADETAAPTASVDEADTISRTLLLAQRTADTTVAEAKAEAERIERVAGAEAAKTIDSTREMSARLLDEAREEARRSGEAERTNIKTEVDSLRARRDFLESDVDHLERHLAEERVRLREAAGTLIELTELVPGGLGEVRRPLLSASDDDTPTGTEFATATESDFNPTGTDIDPTGTHIDSPLDGGVDGEEPEFDFDEEAAERIGNDDAFEDGVDAADDAGETGGLYIRADIADDEFGDESGANRT